MTVTVPRICTALLIVSGVSMFRVRVFAGVEPVTTLGARDGTSSQPQLLMICPYTLLLCSATGALFKVMELMQNVKMRPGAYLLDGPLRMSVSDPGLHLSFTSAFTSCCEINSTMSPPTIGTAALIYNPRVSGWVSNLARKF